MSLGALKLALRSDRLQLLSENDAYALASAWLEHHEHLIEDEKETFKGLARCLRFHHMTPGFLMTAVLGSLNRSGCPFVARLCRSAVAYQSVATSIRKVPNDGNLPPAFNSVKRSRVRGKEVIYTLEVEVLLEDCLRPAWNGEVTYSLGVVEGYLVSLNVEKEDQNDKAPTVGLYAQLTWPENPFENDEETDTVRLSGPMAAMLIEAAGQTRSFTRAFENYRGFGFPDFFNKP
jgi:hypothetical protein